VKNIDDGSAESAWSTANSGAIAFTIDTTAPAEVSIDSPSGNKYLSNTRPEYSWTGVTDTDLADYELIMDNGDSGDFSIGGIAKTGSGTTSNDKYDITHENFNDGDADNDKITLTTKSSGGWGSSENNGEVVEGKRTLTIRATDTAGNSSNSNRVFFSDQTAPSDGVSLNGAFSVTKKKNDPYDILATTNGTLGVRVSLASPSSMSNLKTGVKELTLPPVETEVVPSD